MIFDYEDMILDLIGKRLEESVPAFINGYYVQREIYNNSRFAVNHADFMSANGVAIESISNWMREDEHSGAPLMICSDLSELYDRLCNEDFKPVDSGWFLTVKMANSKWRLLRREDHFAFGLVDSFNKTCRISDLREDSFDFMRVVDSSLPAIVKIAQEAMDSLSKNQDECADLVPVEKTLYKDNAPTSREIWLSVDQETVSMILQDLGPACVMMTGEEEYERVVSCNLKDLEDKLGFSGVKQVMTYLSEHFTTSDSIDLFMNFLSKHGIKYDYYSD